MLDFRDSKINLPAANRFHIPAAHIPTINSTAKGQCHCSGVKSKPGFAVD